MGDGVLQGVILAKKLLQFDTVASIQTNEVDRGYFCTAWPSKERFGLDVGIYVM